MQNFLVLILQFFIFWFIDAPKGLIDYFFSLDSALMKYFSLGVLASTFVKPWKNEYREGLVGFSIFMGMSIKSILIFFDLVLLIIFIIFELVFIFLFIIWPVITVGLFFV